jgi:hypothetical protein
MVKKSKRLEYKNFQFLFIQQKVLSIIALHTTKLMLNELYNNMSGMMYPGKKLIFVWVWLT